jgi:hypothetical protein
MPRRRSPDGAPAAAQRRGGTTLTPTSGNPPSGGEEGAEPRLLKPCRRSPADAIHTSFNHRGTIAGSPVLRPPAESADRFPVRSRLDLGVSLRTRLHEFTRSRARMPAPPVGHRHCWPHARGGSADKGPPQQGRLMECLRVLLLRDRRGATSASGDVSSR